METGSQLNISLAPLQGLTGLSFRKAFFKTFGNSVDFSISPFISLTHGDLSTSLKKLNDIIPFVNKNSIPVIPQILGKESPQFIQLANNLWQLGYKEINWNLGCPVSRIVHKKRGSGLLPYPNEIEKFLETVFGKIENRLSIKMRLGYSSPDEILELIPILNKFPLSFICVHPRLGTQMYEGNLLIDKFSSCYQKLLSPVIFNGDICSLADFQSLKKKFPDINSFMIGRGLLKNPFLAGSIKGIRYKNPIQLFQNFEYSLSRDIFNTFSPEKNKLNKMKEYWQYFGELFQSPTEILKIILPIQSINEYEKAIQEIFCNNNLHSNINI